MLTFDYRSIGRSLHSPVRAVKARISDWVQLDAAAAFDFLERELAPARLVTIGHSYFPGSRLGFAEDLPREVAIEWARWWRHPPRGRGARPPVSGCKTGNSGTLP